MEMGNQEPANSSQNSIILTSVRDIKIYHDLDPSAMIRAKLQGIVTRVDARGGIIFFKLYDGTDSIQLIANRDNFDEATWESIRSIKRLMRLSIDSSVGTSRSGVISIILQSLPIQTPEFNVDLLPDKLTEPRTIESQIFLARLRSQASKFFADKDFVELETNFISASWEVTGLYPLRVDYPGFGGPAYLVPSPSPQLLRALVVTGKPKMFSISRCFTTSYRDSSSSYQSLTLCAKEIGGTFDQIINVGVEAIRTILSDIATRPLDASFLTDSWPSVELSWPPRPTALKITNPQIHIFKEFPNDKVLLNREINLFRICWPPDFILAEGATEILESSVMLNSLTLHIERMVLLVQSDPSLRRLWNEGLKKTD
jgi:lysyl-tRNA synthetase class II